MPINQDDVRYVARLARLELTDEQVAMYQEQLSKILDHAERVTGLDTEGVEPTAQAIPLHNVFRPDLVTESLRHEETFANAPHEEQGHFRVPRILEEADP